MEPQASTKERPADIPVYTLTEACRYLRVPPDAVVAVASTGRAHSWHPFSRLLDYSPDALLSFRQLVTAHVLAVLHRWEEVGGAGFGLNTWPGLKTIQAIAESLPSESDWRGDVGNQLIEVYRRAFRLNAELTPKLRSLLDLHLSRVEWGKDGTPARLYPFTRVDPQTAPKLIALEPGIRSGRPVLLRRGIPTDVIRGRFQAGEGIAGLTDDYAMEIQEVEEILRYEGGYDS